LNDDQKEVLRRAEKNACDLLDLINVTLDLSRIEVSDLPLQVEEVSFATLASAVIGDVRGARPRMETQLSWREAEATTVESDTGKVKIVLKQILGAAIDSTLSGHVEMRALPEPNRIVIEVGDVEPFDAKPLEAAGDASAERGELVLNVARRLLEILGGDLTVHSSAAAGVIFRVRLPRSIRI
jgi:signal transduction histidine kinase